MLKCETTPPAWSPMFSAGLPIRWAVVGVADPETAELGEKKSRRR